MKIRHRKESIRRDWVNHPDMVGLVREQDLFMTRRSRLCAKVLLFDNAANLRRSMKAIGKHVGVDTVGMVTAMSTTHERIGKDGSVTASKLLVDPRYYCLIALAKTHLTHEVVCHESVHAGCAYARRHMMRAADGDDEEAIAYPTGKIAYQLFHWLIDNGEVIRE